MSAARAVRSKLPDQDVSSAIARGLAQWLRRSLPNASGLVLGVGPDGRSAIVRAAVRLPGSWVGRLLQGKIFPADAAGLNGIELPQRVKGYDHWWLPLDVAAGTLKAMIVFVPPNGVGRRKGARPPGNSLGLSRLSAIAKLARHGALMHPAINAKQQWEATVDVLPEIICLLDRERRVSRINRTIERWGLGNVQDSIGCDLHALLHPHCDGANCALRQALDDGWRRAAGSSKTAEIQVADSTLNRNLNISVRHLSRRAGIAGLEHGIYAVCAISDVSALLAAQKQLRMLNEDLEERVRVRTDELMRTNADLIGEIGRREEAENELRESRNELSSLSVQLMHAQEIERKHISQELHDAVGQSLSAVKYTLERSVQLLGHPELGDLAAALELAVAHVYRTIEDVRAISSSLRPPLLDDLGPASAIRAFCREWNAVYSHIALSVDVPLGDADIPRTLGVSLFRIVQEALNNVAKHADAKTVAVAVRIEDLKLSVEVSDDGVGFSQSHKTRLRNRGSGWRGMRERAEHDGGKLTLISSPGCGATLAVVWPLPANQTPAGP